MSEDYGGTTTQGVPDIEPEALEEMNAKDEDELTDAEVTSKIKLSVKRRFDFPTWVTVFEFQNRNGRRADCLAFNCKPSRNFPLVGFEFKASRSDWLQEKRDHEKADYFVQLCDEWYVVAGRRGIVEEEELPDGWGLLELKPSGQLWNLVESDLNEMQNTSLDRRFYTRFMRKAIGEESNFSMEDIQEAERRGYEKAKKKAVDDLIGHEEKRLKSKSEAFDKLSDAGLAGITSVSDERVDRLKRAENLIQQVESDRFGTLGGEIEAMERDAERHFEKIQERVEELQDDFDVLRGTVDGDIDD